MAFSYMCIIPTVLMLPFFAHHGILTEHCAFSPHPPSTHHQPVIGPPGKCIRPEILYLIDKFGRKSMRGH